MSILNPQLSSRVTTLAACVLLACLLSSALSQTPPAVDLSVVGAGGSSPARVSKPHSFTGPNAGSVPFWQHGGTSVVNEEYARAAAIVLLVCDAPPPPPPSLPQVRAVDVHHQQQHWQHVEQRA